MRNLILLPLFVFLSFTADAEITDAFAKEQVRKLCPECNDDQLVQTLIKERSMLNRIGLKNLSKTQGFLSPEDVSIPEKVRAVAKSVLYMMIISRDSSTIRKLSMTLLKEHLPSIKEFKSPAGQKIHALVSAYFIKCEQDRQEVCAIPGLPTGMVGAGSAFLMGASGKELWTANHVMEEAIRQAAGNSESGSVIPDLIARKIKFDVLLFDSEGRLVVTPWTNSVRIVAASSPVPMSPNATVPQIDGLKLELENPLSIPGLSFADSPANVEETVFHLGYPVCTGCEDHYVSDEQWLQVGTRFPFQDARGSELRITVGEIYQQNPVLTSNADAVHGMSGGPAVNASGMVVGINSRAIPEVDYRRLYLPFRGIELAPVR